MAALLPMTLFKVDEARASAVCSVSGSKMRHLVGKAVLKAGRAVARVT